MSEEYRPDVISLLDENDEEHNFEILDIIEDDRGKFYALAPIFDTTNKLIVDNGEYIILEASENEDGEIDMIEPSDEYLLKELENEFEDRFNALFEHDDNR